MANPKQRRIMRAFKIFECSVVDRPANEHCKMTLIKRDTRKDDDVKAQQIFNRTNPPVAFTSFEEAVDHLRTVDKLDGCTAYSKAHDLYPSLVARHNAEGLAIARKGKEAKERRHPSEDEWDDVPEDEKKREAAARKFQTEVATIKRAQGCTGVQAAQRARALFPHLLSAME